MEEQEEHRLPQGMKEERHQLEQRVQELTALNKLLQEHLHQRFEMVEAYTGLLESLQKLAQEASALAEQARSQPYLDLAALRRLDRNGSNISGYE